MKKKKKNGLNKFNLSATTKFLDIKKAMLSVHSWVNQQAPNTIKLLMQVHDELVFEIKTDCAQAYTKQICELMSQAASLDVPLIVEADEGENWEQAH